MRPFYAAGQAARAFRRAFMQAEPKRSYLEELLELAVSGTLGTDFNFGVKSPFRSTVAFRVVTLVAQSIGWLVSEGFLHVEDRNGDQIKNRRTDHILDLMCGMPDGNLQSEQYWGDAGAEFAVWGNSLIHVRRNDLYVPTKLELLSARDSELIQGYQGGRMYRTAYLDDEFRNLFELDRQDVIHGRWPILMQGTGGVRHGFARSPIRELQDAILIALATDGYIKDFFGGRGGSLKSQLAVGLEKYPTKDELAQIMQMIRGYAKPGSRLPLVVGGNPKFFQLKSTPSDAETSKLREIQSREIARIFGAPPPVIGENVTNWGQGISELVRMFYRFGLRHQLGAILSACSARLLLPKERFVINETIVNRGDPKGSAMLINSLVKVPGGLSAKEARRIGGLPSEVDGTPVSAAAAPPAPPSEPTPEPAPPDQGAIVE